MFIYLRGLCHISAACGEGSSAGASAVYNVCGFNVSP